MQRANWFGATWLIDGCVFLFSYLSSRFYVPPCFSYLSSVLSASLLSNPLVSRVSLCVVGLLFCRFWCLSGPSHPRFSLSPSLPFCVCQLVCLAATQTLLSQKRSHSHTGRNTHTYATRFTHTQTRRHALSQVPTPTPTHTQHTRARTCANTDTTNQRTHAHICAHVRAPARPSARPCMRHSVRLVCRATLLAPRSAVLSWSVLACHDVLRPCVSQDGATALHDAAYNGHAPCIEVLLRAGADISTQRKVSAVTTSRANSDRRDVVVVFRCVVPSPKRFSLQKRSHSHTRHNTQTHATC